MALKMASVSDLKHYTHITSEDKTKPTVLKRAAASSSTQIHAVFQTHSQTDSGLLPAFSLPPPNN